MDFSHLSSLLLASSSSQYLTSLYSHSFSEKSHCCLVRIIASWKSLTALKLSFFLRKITLLFGYVLFLLMLRSFSWHWIKLGYLLAFMLHVWLLMLLKTIFVSFHALRYLDSWGLFNYSRFLDLHPAVMFDYS